jgi:hypothetical protein
LSPGPPLTLTWKIAAHNAGPVPGSAAFTFICPLEHVTSIASAASLVTLSELPETLDVTAANAGVLEANNPRHTTVATRPNRRFERLISSGSLQMSTGLARALVLLDQAAG